MAERSISSLMIESFCSRSCCASRCAAMNLPLTFSRWSSEAWAACVRKEVSSSILVPLARIFSHLYLCMFFSVRRLSICSRTLALTAATSEALLLSFWQRFLMMAIWRSTLAFCSIMRAKPPWLAVTARSTSARIWLRSASRSCCTSCSPWMARM